MDYNTCFVVGGVSIFQPLEAVVGAGSLDENVNCKCFRNAG